MTLFTFPTLLNVVCFYVALDLLIFNHVEKSRGIPFLDLIYSPVPFADQIKYSGVIILDIGESYKVIILPPDINA